MESDRFTRHSYEDWMNERAADVERDAEGGAAMESDTPRTDALVEADGLRRLIVARELERELAAAIKQRDEARGQTWYLLYGGTSADGRGQGKYIGRTTDKEVARKHHAECRKNPFSIGFVEIVTDTEKKQVSYYGTELQSEKEGGGA